MVKKERIKKYFAPQHNDKNRPCDCEGCSEKGEYRAPKDKDLKEYYWFCLKHVQEYNAKWNYYEGEIPQEETSKKMHGFKNFKSKIKYRFGDDIPHDYMGWAEYESDFANMERSYFSAEEKRCLSLMEISADSLCINNLKKQYKHLVKKYHPDVNHGDKNCEEKFKQITAAYNVLLAKLS